MTLRDVINTINEELSNNAKKPIIEQKIAPGCIIYDHEVGRDFYYVEKIICRIYDLWGGGVHWQWSYDRYIHDHWKKDKSLVVITCKKVGQGVFDCDGKEIKAIKSIEYTGDTRFLEMSADEFLKVCENNEKRIESELSEKDMSDCREVEAFLKEHHLTIEELNAILPKIEKYKTTKT